MVELGQLEARQHDFARRNARIVVASLDSREESAKTQADFPHLVVVSDAEHKLADAAELIASQHSPTGGPTLAPTTFLIGRDGNVRSILRPDRFIERISPDELLSKLE